MVPERTPGTTGAWRAGGFGGACWGAVRVGTGAEVKKDNKYYADLAMKITSNRATWTLRSWLLVEMLRAAGIDAEWVLTADTATVNKALAPFLQGKHDANV